MKVSHKKAALTFVVLALAVAIIEILIIAAFLPYDIIGGGRYLSREDAVIPAAISIVVLAIESGIVLVAYRQWSKNRLHVVLRIVLTVMLIGLCVNVVGNVLGITPFERIAMTLVCAVQMLCIIRLLTGVGKDAGEV
jgi:hypothetical protein